MQCKKSPLPFLHLSARLRSLSNTVQIIASNASNSGLNFLPNIKDSGGLNCSIDSPLTAATLSHLLLSTPLLQPPYRLSTQRAHAKSCDLNYTWHSLKQSISANRAKQYVVYRPYARTYIIPMQLLIARERWNCYNSRETIAKEDWKQKSLDESC